MNTFAPLFSGIVESSVWREPYHVRVLWVTMLAIKDFDHVVRRTLFALADRAKITEEEAEDAIRVLSEPDTRRKGQPNEGRRIQKVDDGWLILNGQAYEDQMRAISRRFYKARKQREYRLRDAAVPRGTINNPGEAAYVKAQENGATEAQLQSIIDESLPLRKPEDE